MITKSLEAQLGMPDPVSTIPEIRKMIYTTNAIESVNMGLRKVTQELWFVPNRRGAAEVVLPGAMEHQPEVDDADLGLES